METFVYLETAGGKLLPNSLEALTPAKALGEAVAILVGPGLTQAAGVAAHHGADVILADCPADCPDQILAALELLARERQPGLTLFPATQLGKSLAPRLARRLGGGCVTDASAVECREGRLVFTRSAFSGSILEELAVEGPACATVRSGSFAKPAEEAAGAVETCPLSIPEDAVKTRLTQVTHDIAELVDLESADVIVAGGLGMGSAEGFALVQELARALGGVVGASRPAIENGWISRPHQIGQSGKSVAPKLYIACGISGATQHISGALSAKYIVAINKDEDAPIFQVADVGLVGDARELIPALLAELRKGVIA